jgi:preprotein translocase subunit SecD
MKKLFLLPVSACILAACSDSRPTADVAVLPTQSPAINTSGLTGWFYVADSGVGTPIDSTPILTVDNFKTVSVFREPSGSKELYGINIVFDQAGTKQFMLATEKAKGKKLAFLLFGRVVMAPEVTAPVTSGRTTVYLDQYYTLSETHQISALLNRQR